MTQRLLAYFSTDFTNDDVDRLRNLIEGLATSEEWSRDPPQFVDQVEDDSCTIPEDEPVRTVGLLLLVSEREEDPATPVAEPARVVDALAKFSEESTVDFEFQLGDTYVGEIRKGVPDRLLKEGLLAQW